MKLRYLDHIEYTFNPKNLDTLKPLAKRFIGKRIRGHVLWEIEDGPYKGQRAIGFGYSCTDFDEPYPDFFWTPEEDCDDIISPELVK